MKKVDLNVDIGEGFPYDEALLDFATSANVCCGEHAGSWELTLQTIEMCKRKGVRIGMHPGFPDRESMGRRTPNHQELNEFCDSLEEQCHRFLEEADANYVKPHGAWYNMLCGRRPDITGEQARDAAFVTPTLFDVLIRSGLPAMLMDSPTAGVIRKSGGSVISEGFADRAYLPDGTLMPRSEPGAVLHDPDEIKAQVLRLAPEVDSICLHGDTPGCLEFAEMVRKTLEDAGYEVGF